MAEERNGSSGTIKRAAIRDIAEQAGVSIATVSRVLNGRPDVAAATRDIVLERVRTLGYVTNRSARALASGRTGLIGLVVPYTQNDFFSGIVEGASEAVSEHDARLVLCHTQHQHDREVTVLERLMHGTTDGTLLVTPRETVIELRHVQTHGSPYVVIDPSAPVEDGIPVVSSANWAGGRSATEHLLALGHTRIGVITGRAGWCASVDRLAGYQSALLAAGISINPDYIRTGDFQYESGFEGGMALLTLPDPPTAIFAQCDNMAIGAMRAARSLGLTLPDDLSIVGFDDLEVAGVTTPALTTVRQPLRELGRHAITMLYRQIDGQAMEATRVELSTRLIVRESTAPPRAANLPRTLPDRQK